MLYSIQDLQLVGLISFKHTRKEFDDDDDGHARKCQCYIVIVRHAKSQFAKI